MMFYALAICVCLAALFMVLAGASLASRMLSRTIAAIARSRRPAAAANLLFAVRALPSFLAVSLTLGLALPAFLKFEPRGTGEAMSARLLLLSAAGAIVLIVMAVRCLRILRSTAQTEKVWRTGGAGRKVSVAGSQVSLHYVESSPALLAVTGFFRPRIFVAEEIAQLLSPNELSAALAHEMAHVTFFDNLKQLVLKVSRLPNWLGGSTLDRAWLSISEVAADEAALASGASALDLASALVKLSALKRNGPAAEHVAASHLLPDLGGSALEMRVARLQRALENATVASEIGSRPQRWRFLAFIMLPALAYVAAVSSLLPAIHEALEFLVR